MREAVIVSTARTPIGKAYRGGFNNLASPTLASHAIAAAVARAGVDPGGEPKVPKFLGRYALARGVPARLLEKGQVDRVGRIRQWDLPIAPPPPGNISRYDERIRVTMHSMRSPVAPRAGRAPG